MALGLLWSLWGTCAGSDPVTGSAPSIPILETLDSSGAQRLFGLSLVASMISGCMGDAAAIGEDGGGESS